ncbi:MAG TPA: N-acetyltransferase [bacterium]|nr:N-acetyltransferase [bacterium]
MEMINLALTAELGKGTKPGPFSVIMDNVIIGRDCRIGSHVVIYPKTRIGHGVRIDDHTVIGKPPMRAPRSIFQEEKEWKEAVIGDECILGTHVVVYRGCEIGSHVLVADHASVREEVQIGEYTIIGRGVTVENKCTIGRKCKLETQCYITAYSVVEDYCFIAPMVTTTNDNYMGRDEERFKHFKGMTVKRGGRIGANSTILPGKIIGPDAMVGAGSLVARHVKGGKCFLGNPVRKFGDVPKGQRLENQGWE